MAHTKAGGSKAGQGGNVSGKRLGVKLSDGQKAAPGSIIVRQRGTKIHPGDGVGMGRDYTIFALRSGKVSFSRKGKRRRKVSVSEGF